VEEARYYIIVYLLLSDTLNNNVAFYVYTVTHKRHKARLADDVSLFLSLSFCLHSAPYMNDQTASRVPFFLLAKAAYTYTLLQKNSKYVVFCNLFSTNYLKFIKVKVVWQCIIYENIYKSLMVFYYANSFPTEQS
jgi:hypothetical protein